MRCTALLRQASAASSTFGDAPMLAPVQLARHLLESRKGGQLSSVKLAQELEFDQAPLFSSLVAYVRRASGDLVLGLPANSQHIGNFAKYSSMASLLVAPITPEHINPVEFPVVPKFNVSGTVQPVAAEQRQSAIEELRTRHRIPDHVVDKVSPHVLHVDSGVLTPGQQSPGRSSYEFSAADIAAADVDPLAAHQLYIIEQLALPRHKDKLHRAIAYYADLDQPVSDAFVFNVDRYGFDSVGQIGDYWRRFRLPFPLPLSDPTLALKAVLEGLDEAAQAAYIRSTGQ